MRLLAQEEFAEATSLVKQLNPNVDPDSDKNATIEITAGVGGDEACLFAESIFRMYARYAKARGWALDLEDASHNKKQGLKSIRFTIEGAGAFGRLRFESGVHRVQRFSETSAQDIMHTSAAAVVVLPVVEDPSVVIHEKDIRVDTFSSGGPGGQSVNTSTSACRLLHIPTDIMVQCQDERSLIQNLARARKTLAARVLDHFRAEQEEKAHARRLSLRGRGSRCEKIRTYNFPQDRVTDHRINFTTHNLPKILSGGLDPVLDALALADAEDKAD